MYSEILSSFKNVPALCFPANLDDFKPSVRLLRLLQHDVFLLTNSPGVIERDSRPSGERDMTCFCPDHQPLRRCNFIAADVAEGTHRLIAPGWMNRRGGMYAHMG